MNIFVAILMDGYAEAVEAGKRAAEAAGLPAPDAVYDDVLKAMSKMIKKIDKRSWVYTDHALLSIMLAIDEETHDPITLHSTYKLRRGKELEELKEDRERIQERIDFLENFMAENIADQPFHLVWQDKSVSYKQIAERFARHPALEKHGVLLSDVQEIYDLAPLSVSSRAVRYVEKLEHQEEGTHVHVADADDILQTSLHDGLRKRIKELMLDNTLLIEQHKQLLNAQADASPVNAAGASGVTRNNKIVQAQLVLRGNECGDQAPTTVTQQ